LKEKENYMRLSVQELKNLLKQKKQKVCGKKEVLVERLIMSNLDEINLRIKNELLYKLNIIKKEPVSKVTTTHNEESSTKVKIQPKVVEKMTSTTKTSLAIPKAVIAPKSISNINSRLLQNNNKDSSKSITIPTNITIPSLKKEELKIEGNKRKSQMKNVLEEEGFVASRVLPIAQVLKNIKGTECNSISEQYYRLKRKFEFQQQQQQQQQQYQYQHQHHHQHHHHHSHPILKKAKLMI